MEQLQTLEGLFHHQLKDLYSAETQLIEELPQLRDQARSQKLRNTISDHLDETKEHKNRLTDIAKTLDLDLTGETCKAMKGLIKEAKSFISEEATLYVQDAGIIADAQRIEHYEISAYGTALQFAKALKHDVAINKLQQTLNEEKDADQELTFIAEETINPQAQEA
jgi:ferritin-like metal-binding protein YciE